MRKALGDKEIADACNESFSKMWDCPTAWNLRSNVDEDVARSIHSYGFHSAGEWVSQYDSEMLDRLLIASKQVLAHFDKIRPADKEPSSMVTELRKSIRELERR